MKQTFYEGIWRRDSVVSVDRNFTQEFLISFSIHDGM